MDHRCHHKLYCHSTSPCVGGTSRVLVREGEEAGAEGGVETEAQAVRDSELRGKRKNQTFTCAIWFSLEWLLLCVTSLTEPSWFFETICLVWFLRYFCLLSPATLYKCVSYAYLSLYPLNLYSCYLTKWNVCMIITLKHFAFHCPIQEPLVVWGCLSLGLN